MNSLQQTHAQWLERLKSEGEKVLTFNCPYCEQEIATLAAPDGQVFDTAAVCIHCEELYWRQVTNTEVNAQQWDKRND